MYDAIYMGNFLKTLLTIYLILWILIGAVVLAGASTMLVFMARMMPVISGTLGSFGSSGSPLGALGPLGGMMGLGGIGGYSGIAARLSDPSERQNLFKNLPASQQTCLKSALGEKELQRALTDKNFEITSSLIAKVSSCLQR